MASSLVLSSDNSLGGLALLPLFFATFARTMFLYFVVSLTLAFIATKWDFTVRLSLFAH
ncbi:MAG: hypothetical protein P4L33_04210 [Capsulimonadaceae bacterium]|nr:hypothetical protein [Capsulimonadaceae bacterium]